jgi:hypothetical protein
MTRPLPGERPWRLERNRPPYLARLMRLVLVLPLVVIR